MLTLHFRQREAGASSTTHFAQKRFSACLKRLSGPTRKTGNSLHEIGNSFPKSGNSFLSPIVTGGRSRGRKKLDSSPLSPKRKALFRRAGFLNNTPSDRLAPNLGSVTFKWSVINV